MKKRPVIALLLAYFGTISQVAMGASGDAERLRIGAERARLETAQAREEAACYKRFWVNSCLDEVKVRSRDALADLRRQEIVLNDEARKAKAAEQLQKTEEKSSPETLQQEADKRAQASKDFEDKVAREKQKIADRDGLASGETAKSNAVADRIKSNQAKAASLAAKQAGAAEQLKKYNERRDQAKERQARFAKEKASQTTPPAQPLPVPR